jgi:predicted metal-dependent peptidase
MKFTKVMGTINPSLVAQAEEKLSQVFLDLGVKYDNRHVGTGMGGDPLIFSLLYPVEHICTMSMPTAATDGKRFYWNPKFVLKQSKIGLRIICGHEAWHALYMHPQRRGSRLPKLWNIAVDYIVNGTVMDDFKARQMDATKQFKDHLGRFMTLTQYAELIKNPFAQIKGFEDLNTSNSDSQVELPSPDEDRDLTPEEQKELERREKKTTFYFADPDLEEEMKKPEKIYDYLYSLLPKCPECGRVGVYSSKSKDKNKQDSKNEDKSDQSSDSDQSEKSDADQHDHGDGQSCNCNDHKKNGSGCDHCGDGVDVFGLGGTVDEHMDTEESEEKLAKKISDAMEAAKKMAGVIPASLEDELGKLTAPKVTWQDIVRTRILKARSGNGKNDWTRFKSRPMFSGLLVPKRKNYYAHFGCLLDTSGSMSKDDIAFGISQLQSLDERSEGTVTPADCEIYWDKSTKLKNCSQEELNKIKIVGRGGTLFASYLSEYEKHIGKCDFLIVITDGYLMESDIIEMKNPGIDVIWIITSGLAFKAPFGRVFNLRD